MARVSFFLIELRPAEHFFFEKRPFDQFEFETPGLISGSQRAIGKSFMDRDNLRWVSKKNIFFKNKFEGL